MRTGQADRLWLIGGAVVAVVLVAVSWFLLIGPAKGHTANLNDQADAARTQLTSLQHRLSELQRQNEKKADYQAQLLRDQSALPTKADLAEFLRGLQSGDESHGVVSGILVGTPLEQTAAGRKVFALPVTVTANGTATELDGLLDHLQQVQPRAVLVRNVHLTGDQTGALSGTATLTIALQVFVTSAEAVPAATPAAKPS
jgi:type IV pilus assembly protein PilO